MSDEVPAETVQSPPPEPRPKPPKFRRQLAHWLGELVTVFVGVYAAFFLNYRASHRQERQRREQLLTWVEEQYQGVLDNSQKQAVKLRGTIDAFNRKLAAGETPEIKPIGWTGDYDPSDMTSLLQSGGYDLLDIETIRDMRDVESTVRQMISIATHAQQRSDALILPNLGKDASTFYDPATHRLREPYAWVPAVDKAMEDSLEDLQTECTKLLAQVKAERARKR